MPPVFSLTSPNVSWRFPSPCLSSTRSSSITPPMRGRLGCPKPSVPKRWSAAYGAIERLCAALSRGSRAVRVSYLARELDRTRLASEVGSRARRRADLRADHRSPHLLAASRLTLRAADRRSGDRATCARRHRRRDGDDSPLSFGLETISASPGIG